MRHASIAVDHYVDDRDISVLALQETLHVPPSNIFKNLVTYGVPYDRGVTLSIHSGLRPQQIESLEISGVAAVFVVVTVANRPVMFASAYSSPTGDLSALLNSIQSAWDYCRINGVSQLFVMGDFNARGMSWGDRLYLDWKDWTNYLDSLLGGMTVAHQADPVAVHNFLLESIEETCNLLIPKKTVCRHSKPYWTEELTDLSMRLRAAQNQYRYRRTHANKETLEEAKLLFKDELIRGRNSWIHKRLEGLNVADTRIFWKRYRSTFLPPEENYIGCLQENGRLLHGELEKEDLLFDTFFGGKHLRGSNFDEDHYRAIKNEVEGFLLEEVDEEDELSREVSVDEVGAAISAQKCGSKTVDGDGIHPQFIKHLGHGAKAFLAEFFTLCLKSSTWPWKSAIVTFIKKQGKKTYLNPGSFRPISITSYIGKVLERIIDRRMRELCDMEDILDDEQEGFLPVRSTTRYLYRLLSTLHENRRRKATAFILLLDFEKAFDSVPTDCLIYKLHGFGVKGHLLRLLHCMLSSRLVKLKINGKIGRARACTLVGLPQGGVLSPLLFILYIADLLTTRNLPNGARGCSETFKFADDGTVVVTGTQVECESAMLSILEYLEEWCNKWRLIVNCDRNKTEILVVFPKRWDPAPLPIMTLGSKTINYTDSSKVLGVYLDSELSFKKHSTFILQKCWYSWGILSGSTSRTAGLNSSALSILFKTVVLTKLLYASPLWLKERLADVKNLMTKAKLKILGSQFYISGVLSDLLTTIPPLSITLEVLTTKFILKGLTARDTMTAKLFQIETEPRHVFYNQIAAVKKYLEWAETQADINSGRQLTEGRSFRRRCELLTYDPDKLHYSKEDMDLYLWHLWDSFVRASIGDLVKGNYGEGSLDDFKEMVDTGALSACPLVTRSMDRETSTRLLDFTHGHNLRFQNFAFSVENRSQVIEEPFCLECGVELDSTFHKLFQCTSAGAVSALRGQCQPLSDCTANFHIPLSFSRDRNLKQKFRNLVNEISANLEFGEELANAAKVRFKRLDLRFLEIGVLRVIFTKRDPEFPGISGQVA
eukprot:sb/3461489/